MNDCQPLGSTSTKQGLVSPAADIELGRHVLRPMEPLTGIGFLQLGGFYLEMRLYGGADKHTDFGKHLQFEISTFLYQEKREPSPSDQASRGRLREVYEISIHRPLLRTVRLR